MKNNKEKGMLHVKHTLFYVKINYKIQTKRNREIILVARDTTDVFTGNIQKAKNCTATEDTIMMQKQIVLLKNQVL